VAGCCEYSDQTSSSGATELASSASEVGVTSPSLESDLAPQFKGIELLSALTSIIVIFKGIQ
jgi:hypothetical protein